MNRYEVKMEMPNGDIMTGAMKCKSPHEIGDVWNVGVNVVTALRPLKDGATCDRTLNGKKLVKGLESDSMSYMQAVCMDDEHREITCPECGGTRYVEPDADYIYDCECGVKVKVPSFLI